MSKEKRKNEIHVYQFDLENVPIELPEKIYSDIKQIVTTVMLEERKNSSCEISVILTSDNYITKLNKEYLNRDQPTDVLCFPYSTGKHFTSDIFISVERANEHVASGLMPDLKSEILFLTLHGCLHLFGWKDDSETNRKKMWNRQKELLKLSKLI
ncbi:MAG: rRNA maturation RNase YbeY [Elusimicrobiota bacterium]|nr:rRNA maturation RNase YbeY [Elusimicrobiota bacterium]